MDATEFLSLWHADRASARQRARALGAAFVGLAVALSAQFEAHDPRASYRYWMRSIRCPDLPADLHASGWRWAADEDLASERLRVIVRQDGEAGIAAARAITEALHEAKRKPQQLRMELV